MVELSGKSDPFQHSFPNVVFIIPAIITLGLMGKSFVNIKDVMAIDICWGSNKSRLKRWRFRFGCFYKNKLPRSSHVADELLHTSVNIFHELDYDVHSLYYLTKFSPDPTQHIIQIIINKQVEHKHFWVFFSESVVTKQEEKYFHLLILKTKTSNFF